MKVSVSLKKLEDGWREKFEEKNESVAARKNLDNQLAKVAENLAICKEHLASQLTCSISPF